MDTAIVAALLAGGFSLAGVVVLAAITLRQSKQAIRSSEGIALRDSQRRDNSEIHTEMAGIKLELQRCNDDRAADSLQRTADADRHAADEDQRRASDERHRADEQRHAVDVSEIASQRQEITMLRHDLTEIQRKLRSMADAARGFGEASNLATEITENEDHP